MAKQQSVIVAAAQKVAKAEAKRVKIQKDYADKLSKVVEEIETARKELTTALEGD